MHLHKTLQFKVTCIYHSAHTLVLARLETKKRSLSFFFPTVDQFSKKSLQLGLGLTTNFQMLSLLTFRLPEIEERALPCTFEPDGSRSGRIFKLFHLNQELYFDFISFEYRNIKETFITNLACSFKTVNIVMRILCSNICTHILSLNLRNSFILPDRYKVNKLTCPQDHCSVTAMKNFMSKTANYIMI